MKKIRAEKDKLFTIVEQNKKIAFKAVIYTAILALLAIVLVAITSVNLFIAISHDLVILTTIIAIIANLLIIACIVFVYGYLKTNIEELKTVNTKIIVKYDAIRLCVIITVVAVAAIFIGGRFLV